MAMVRTQIYLPADLDRKLRREAAKRKISKAELIRQQLAGASGECFASEPTTRPARSEEARQRLLNRLKEVADEATDGPGTGWKFDRGEIYEHRIEKARSGRH